MLPSTEKKKIVPEFLAVGETFAAIILCAVKGVRPGASA